MEYVIWGIPPGADPADVDTGLAERPLYTLATTLAEAERVAAVLKSAHGCRSLRIQSLDDDSVQDMFRRSVRGNRK